MHIRVFLFAILLISTMPISSDASVINPKIVYTYQKLYQDLMKLEQAYPNEIHIQAIGSSEFGRKIWAVKLGNGTKSVLFTGAHHGREWLTTNLLMKMMDVYAHAYTHKQRLYGVNSSLFDEIAIWFVPMVNPDGVTIQQSGVRSFPLANQLLLLEMNENSLDFKRWKANGMGVDLNRQYSAGWEEIKSDSQLNSYQFYKGEKPFEAKEVQALVQFTKKINPLIAVSYHTSGQEIFWYYKNDENVLDRDKKIAAKLSALTGYPLNLPPENAIGGGYTDWFIQTFKRPAFTIEMCPLVEETNPPLSTFQNEWRRNKKIGVVVAKEAKKVMIN